MDAIEAADMARKNQNETVDAFTEMVGEIMQITQAIHDAAAEHFDTTPEEVNWGHVGDATWTRNQLKHVLAVIRGEEGK